jgi:hypothetical protein
MATCMFCRAATHGEPVEHIAPEGLVGHQPFQVGFGSIIAEPRKYLVLDHDEVCRRCNHKLGRLDGYLQDQLGFLRTYWNPVGTKSGRAASARRPGMFAQHGDDGPHLNLNMEEHEIVTPDGVRIPPARTDQMAVRVTEFRVEGRFATLTIEQPTRMNKRFVRALHKIAFELLSLNRGPDFVLDRKFDVIREYVLHGRGAREIVLTCSAEAGCWEQPHFGLRHDPSWPGWLAIIRLAATFYIDLSPANEFFAKASPAALMANNMVKWSDKNGGKPITAAA